MSNFIKEFKIEEEVFKLKNKYGTNLYKYGLIGEERVAHQLKICDEDIICLYDVILEFNSQRSQYDFIVISKEIIFIIEVKNLLGNIEVKTDGVIERLVYKDGVIERCGIFNPFVQLEEQKKRLDGFLKFNGYNKEIVKILTMANDKTIIYGNKEQYNVIRFDELNKFLKKYINNKENDEENYKIGELILKNTKKYNYQISNVIQHKIINQYVPKFVSFADKMYYIQILNLRKELSKKYNMPACNIYNNKEAELLVINKPKSKEEFIAIRGFKEKRFEMFGVEVIKIFKK